MREIRKARGAGVEGKGGGAAGGGGGNS